MDGEDYLCKGCKDELHYLSPPFCSLCMKKFFSTGSETWRCGLCLLKPPPFERVISCFDYNDEKVKRLILQYKISLRVHYSFFFASSIIEFCRTLPEPPDFSQYHMIIPVPTSPFPYNRRLFNPSAEIAKRLGRMLHLKVELNCLFKVRDIPSQSKMSAKGRFENVKGIFEVRDKGKIEGKNLILIDDVVTSTATIREASRVLKKGGCNKILVISLARA